MQTVPDPYEGCRSLAIGLVAVFVLVFVSFGTLIIGRK